MDLRFPHHENEIAQAEAATGKQFAKYWMHSGLLTVNGEKMSKSIGNIINIHDLLKEWPAEVIRLFFAKTHYRRPPDFSNDALEAADKGLQRIHRFKEHLESIAYEKSCVVIKEQLTLENQELYEIIQSFGIEFEQAMDDDLNSPEAIASIFTFINRVNCHIQSYRDLDPKVARLALDKLISLGQLVTLFQDNESIDHDGVEELQDVYREYVSSSVVPENIDDLMSGILEIRKQARDQKDWEKADAIRDAISCLGFEIQDTNDGVQWRKTRK
jgi:cysteinyl-tRNA synthetase